LRHQNCRFTGKRNIKKEEFTDEKDMFKERRDESPNAQAAYVAAANDENDMLLCRRLFFDRGGECSYLGLVGQKYNRPRSLE
jgi:hypothetical protein